MSLNLKTSGLLILAGILVSTIGAVPKIFYNSDALLTSSLVVATVLFFLGFFGIVRNLLKRSRSK